MPLALSSRVLGDALVLSLDTFVRVDNVIDGNFDDISVVDFDLVVKTLSILKTGGEAEIPQVFSRLTTRCLMAHRSINNVTRSLYTPRSCASGRVSRAFAQHLPV